MATPPVCNPQICAPDLCNGLTGGNRLICEAGKDKYSPTINQIYAMGYALYEQYPLLTTNLSSIAQNEFSSWFGHYTSIATIPYLVVFTILIIALMINRTLSLMVGVLLLILLYIGTAAVIVFLIQDASDVVSNIYDDLQNQVYQNLSTYGPNIICNLERAFLVPNCTSTISLTDILGNLLSGFKAAEAADPNANTNVNNVAEPVAPVTSVTPCTSGCNNAPKWRRLFN